MKSIPLEVMGLVSKGRALDDEKSIKESSEFTDQYNLYPAMLSQHFDE